MINGAFAISIFFINSTGLKFLCFLKWKNASFLRKIRSALGLGFRTTCSTCVKKVSFRIMVIFILAVLHVPVVPFIRLNMLNRYWASILEKFRASKQTSKQASELTKQSKMRQNWRRNWYSVPQHFSSFLCTLTKAHALFYEATYLRSS